MDCARHEHIVCPLLSFSCCHQTAPRCCISEFSGLFGHPVAGFKTALNGKQRTITPCSLHGTCYRVRLSWHRSLTPCRNLQTISNRQGSDIPVSHQSSSVCTGKNNVLKEKWYRTKKWSPHLPTRDAVHGRLVSHGRPVQFATPVDSHDPGAEVKQLHRQEEDRKQQAHDLQSPAAAAVPEVLREEIGSEVSATSAHGIFSLEQKASQEDACCCGSAAE